MAEIAQQIALLATGDEIVNGDIYDTNSHYVAQALFEYQLLPGRRVIVADNQPEMEQAILYLLQDHPVLITIGGLGPTSDDRTRFALANALQRQLIFDNASWQRIIKRLTYYELAIPEANKQQCLFPEGAEIIPNENGTASACYLKHNHKHIFMLPGPPKELTPIFNNVVLKKLIDLHLQQSIYRQTWLLLGLSEGNLAEQIETVIKDKNCKIGYRVNQPYIELKLAATDHMTFTTIKNTIHALIQANLISTNRETASQQLYNYLKKNHPKLIICDQVTHGLLQSTLLTPKTYTDIRFINAFTKKYNKYYKIEIKGLEEYWQTAVTKYTHFTMILFDTNLKKIKIDKQILIRGRQTVYLANELICWEILQFLKQFQKAKD